MDKLKPSLQAVEQATRTVPARPAAADRRYPVYASGRWKLLYFYKGNYDMRCLRIL